MSIPAEPSLERPRGPLATYFAATRPAFLGVTAIAVLIGLACAQGSGVRIDPLNAALTLVFALLAHAGVNVINDYHDGVSGADAANTGRLYPFTGGSRFIQNGVLSLRQTALFGYSMLLMVIPAGLWLAWQSGAGLIAIGLVGLLAGWAYSAPPLALMRRGLGELAIVVGWLAVIVGSDYVQRGAFSALPLAAGLSYALLVAGILYINQFPDAAGDAASGKRTLVVRLGAQTASWGYFVLVLLAHGWLLMMIGRPLLPQKAGLALLTLILSLRAAQELRAHADTPQALRPAIKLTLLATHTHGLLLAATLAFAAWPNH